MSDGMTMRIDTTAMNRQIAQLRLANGKATGNCVRYWSRIVLKQLAWNTNKALRRFKNTGRLRAGWWPAANALHSPTVYSGGFPNKNEGYAIDNTNTQSPRASFTMGNTVPYGPFVKQLVPALNSAVQNVESRARAEYESLFKSQIALCGAPGMFR